MLDCILELVLPLVPGAVITVGLIWWLTFVLENYGLGLFFLFLSTITAYVIILFGGVLQACCNRCIDKYIEGCMRRGADDEDLDWAVGDLCSTKDGALFTVADTSHGVALAQLSSNATSSQRLYSPHEIDDVERVATATYISREFTKLEAAVADRDGADTFEMAALGVNRTRGTKSSSPFRALLCCFIQTVAPGLLLLQMVGTHDKQGGALCPWDQGWDLWYTKLTSKGLGVALMLYMYNYVMTAQYKWEAKPSHELLRLGAVLDCYEQPLWACLGLVSNGCALVWGSIGSCVLIFLAERYRPTHHHPHHHKPPLAPPCGPPSHYHHQLHHYHHFWPTTACVCAWLRGCMAACMEHCPGPLPGSIAWVHCLGPLPFPAFGRAPCSPMANDDPSPEHDADLCARSLCTARSTSCSTAWPSSSFLRSTITSSTQTTTSTPSSTSRGGPPRARPTPT